MDEMETGGQSKRSGRRRRSGPEPHVVAVKVRPAPDAEARLRRIAAILLEHATHAAAPNGDGEGVEGR